MRRALLCLLPLCVFALPALSQVKPADVPAEQKPRPHHVSKDDKRHEPMMPPPAPYYCKSTKPDYPNGYPSLTQVSGGATGAVEYGATITGWTPNDNATECRIRQLYFWVFAPLASSPTSPDVNIQLVRHDDGTVVTRPLNWDIVSIPYTGGVLWRVDAEDVTAKPNPDGTYGLQGDFDFVINVAGTVPGGMEASAGKKAKPSSLNVYSVSSNGMPIMQIAAAAYNPYPTTNPVIYEFWLDGKNQAAVIPATLNPVITQTGTIPVPASLSDFDAVHPWAVLIGGTPIGTIPARHQADATTDPNFITLYRDTNDKAAMFIQSGQTSVVVQPCLVSPQVTSF